MEKGSNGFSSRYWEENYNNPEEMDGIANADRHAIYIKAFFDIEYVDISSVIDFGYGLGDLFNEVVKIFRPYRAYGIEPSVHAYQAAEDKLKLERFTSKYTTKCQSLNEWAKNSKPRSARFDLGICTSVFQYLEQAELELVVPIMAKRVKYLYLSVPTDLELKRQVDQYNFNDRYAIARGQQFYLDLLAPHFTIIGNRVLESRTFFKPEDSFFSDYLYRF